MTPDQYTELIEFLSRKFGRIDERFDALGGRLTKVEIRLEALPDDVKLLAEGLSTTNQRLDRYHQDHEIRIRALEAHWFEALGLPLPRRHGATPSDPSRQEKSITSLIRWEVSRLPSLAHNKSTRTRSPGALCFSR